MGKNAEYKGTVLRIELVVLILIVLWFCDKHESMSHILCEIERMCNRPALSEVEA